MKNGIPEAMITVPSELLAAQNVSGQRRQTRMSEPAQAPVQAPVRVAAVRSPRGLPATHEFLRLCATRLHPARVLCCATARYILQWHSGRSG